VRTLVLLTLILGPAMAMADDYWLQADSYHPTAGAHLVVHLNVGQSFAAREEKAFERAHTERFELRLPNDVRDLLGSTNDGIKPVFDDVLPASGPFLISMVSGLEQIGRERSWHFLKLLGHTGDDTETDLHHRFTGMQYEIVLLQNPLTMHAGDEQIVQLLFDTKPLANESAYALRRGADGAVTELTGMSDARGVVRFTLTQSGTWLIRSVHTRPCKGCKDADSESFAAAYSFSVE
jgi:Domain of unknown function (DUF4198)